MNAASTLARIESGRLVMVVRAPSVRAARTAIAAARTAGVRTIEVTFTVPDAVILIRELAADPELVVGAGTVLTLEQAVSAEAAGAQFLVSPGLDEELVRHATARDLLIVPGVFTPSEVMRALALGAAAVKLFPADAVGPAYLKALLGPFPELAVIPSGGVTEADAAAWIAAGAIAVGMSGSLSPTSDTPDIAAITAGARRVLEALGPTHDHTPEGQNP